MYRYVLSLSLLLLLGSGAGSAQANLAERLGYPAGSRLLIVHADDLGVTHATNAASLAALEAGTVTSASVMAPTPWLAEVAEWARRHPDHDLGMHLTLTSEWRNLRWGPVAGDVGSLTDSSGYLKPLCDVMGAGATAADVRTELLAQIARARSLGLEPTHLDSHMGCLIYDPEWFAVYMDVSRQTGIPAMVARPELSGPLAATHGPHVRPTDLVVDAVYTAGVPDYERGLEAYYTDVLNGIAPGVSVLLIHTALDGAESAAMAGGVTGWGNRWRQVDYNFFTGDHFRRLVQDRGITLTTWREVHRRWRALLDDE